MEYRLVGMRPKAILARKWLHWSKRGAVAGIIERESVHTTTSLKSSHRSFPSGGRVSKPGPKANLRVLTQGAAVTDGREGKAAMSFVQKY